MTIVTWIWELNNQNESFKRYRLKMNFENKIRSNASILSDLDHIQLVGDSHTIFKALVMAILTLGLLLEDNDIN